MTIRSRIGDYLFRALFPNQAAALDFAEDAITDAAIAQVRAQAAVDATRRALAEVRPVLDNTRDLVARLLGPGV